MATYVEQSATYHAVQFSGLIHGISEDGVMDIEFPDAHHALMWRESFGHIRLVSLRDPITDFDKPVVVQVITIM